MCTAVGPATSRNCENVVKVHKIMTTVQTANKTGISYTMDQSILTEYMSMQHMCSKFVSTILVEDKMEIRNSLNDQQKEADLLSNIITGDKSWVFTSEPEISVL
jgi:hypothetical protein